MFSESTMESSGRRTASSTTRRFFPPTEGIELLSYLCGRSSREAVEFRQERQEYRGVTSKETLTRRRRKTLCVFSGYTRKSPSPVPLPHV